MKEQEHNLVFVKSKKSDRWWMKIDVFQAKTKQETTYLVPCSYADYQLACRGEIPDRWLASYFRLSTLGAEE